MPKRMLLLLTLLFLLSIGTAATASEVMQSTLGTEYGAWSAWQEEAIAAGEGLEVESAERDVGEEVTVYRYTRYEYVHEEKGVVYASPIEQAGTHVREGSGKWASLEVDAPLAVVGEDEGYAMFEGAWFNEQVEALPKLTRATMFRSRTVKRITCEVSTTELLLFPEDTRALTVNMFDDSHGYQWTSSDTAVATVDGQGNVTGRAVGAARIYVRSSRGREVSIEVYVCDQTATIPEGLYTLRLIKSQKTLVEGRSLGTKRRNVEVAGYTGERKQRFVVSAVGDRVFTMHPIDHRKWRVSVALKNKKRQVGSNIQTTASKDNKSQYFRAIYVPDGSYIIYPKANPKLVVGAEPLVEGGNVRLEPIGDMETLDRWVLIKADESIDPNTPFARPVARDGVSYVAREFAAGDEPSTMRFGSNGRRAFVLAAARGTVTQVHDGCAHDEPKQPDAAGALIDPCALTGDCPGNYVVIDHGGGVTATYAHLSEVFVAVGDAVRQGSLIGRSGATGSAAEVGLGFTMTLDDRPVDPRAYIKLPDTNKPIE